MNERTVLEVIRERAPISRAEVSRAVGISKPTVSLALQSLIDSGLVREARPDGNGPSYGATFFEPVAEAALALGLDIGARFLRGAICDLDGEVCARQDVELAGAEADAALDAAAELKQRTGRLVRAFGGGDRLRRRRGVRASSAATTGSSTSRRTSTASRACESVPSSSGGSESR